MKINLPISILIIGATVSGGIMLSQYQFPEQSEKNKTEIEVIEFNDITSKDNIYGNPSARIKIIEYSDFDCPYCKEFHTTMKRVMDRYAKSGQVAWVYRHIPSQLEGSNAYQASMATECAKNLAPDYGLNPQNTFWTFAQRIFDGATESSQIENLKLISEEIGIDSNALEVCINAERYADKIRTETQDVIDIAQKLNDPNFGTPYVLIITDSGLQTQIIGSESYQNIVDFIEENLSQ
jgi:protein-disulfide isomerase